MKTLKNKRWQKHPWNKANQVEEVSVQFLKSIANPEATEITDDLDGSHKHQSEIFTSIESQGMRDPLLVVISQKHQTIRLEAGNHRIKVAIERGYTHLPIATLIIDEKLLREGNGHHTFDARELIDFSKLVPNPYPYQMTLANIALDHNAREKIFK